MACKSLSAVPQRAAWPLHRLFSTEGPGDGAKGDDGAAEGTAAEGGADDILVMADEEEAEVQPRWRKKLTRKQQGSYVMNEELMEELEMSPSLPPEAGPLYDLRTAAPWLIEAEDEAFDMVRERMEQDEDFRQAVMAEQELNPPYPGARPILKWELRMVLAAGNRSDHPANRRAKCSLYLRDLQEQMGLTDAAVHHIARVSGPRYHPNTGQLVISCEKYPHREENRRAIITMIYALITEGKRAFPDPAALQAAEADGAGQAAAGAAGS